MGFNASLVIQPCRIILDKKRNKTNDIDAANFSFITVSYSLVDPVNLTIILPIKIPEIKPMPPKMYAGTGSMVYSARQSIIKPVK